MGLYDKLGFVRDELLGRYYLNGSDAYRLKLWIGDGVGDSIEQDSLTTDAYTDSYVKKDVANEVVGVLSTAVVEGLSSDGK